MLVVFLTNPWRLYAIIFLILLLPFYMKYEPIIGAFNICFYGVWLLSFLYELSTVSSMIIISCVLCSPMWGLILKNFLGMSKRTFEEFFLVIGPASCLIVFQIFLLGFKDTFVRGCMKSIHNLNSYQDMLERIPDYNWNPNPFHLLDYYYPWGVFIFWTMLQIVILRIQHNNFKKLQEVKTSDSIPEELVGLLHQRNESDEEKNPENLSCGICLDPMYQDEDLLVRRIAFPFSINNCFLGHSMCSQASYLP